MAKLTREDAERLEKEVYSYLEQGDISAALNQLSEAIRGYSEEVERLKRREEGIKSESARLSWEIDKGSYKQGGDFIPGPEVQPQRDRSDALWDEARKIARELPQLETIIAELTQRKETLRTYSESFDRSIKNKDLAEWYKLGTPYPTSKEEMRTLLLDSFEKWNVWRNVYPKVRIDFSGLRFAGSIHHRANLTDVVFHEVDFARVKLQKTTLSGIDLSGADLTEADLSGAKLSGANLSGAKLSKADLSGANLSGANLSGANLIRANLSGANLSKTTLSEADLSVADLSVADLSRADLNGAKLNVANFLWADLSGADLSGADLSGANLRGVKLSEANLSRADLSIALLNEANLSGANLSRADLSVADLSKANLSGANLSEARLVRANLTQVKLENTDFSEATIGETIFVNVDLGGALNLETVDHTAPSIIDMNTIHQSKDRIPKEFLEGAGMHPDIIRWQHSLHTRPMVFISYNHDDETEKNQLLRHLDIVQRIDLVDIWHDERIGAGDEWKKEIEQALARASVAILLISANFLASDFINTQEIPALLQRRKQKEDLVIVPIIAKSCAWQRVDWLAEIQVRPKGGQPIWGKDTDEDEELAKIADEVTEIVKNRWFSKGS